MKNEDNEGNRLTERSTPGVNVVTLAEQRRAADVWSQLEPGDRAERLRQWASRLAANRTNTPAAAGVAAPRARADAPETLAAYVRAAAVAAATGPTGAEPWGVVALRVPTGMSLAGAVRQIAAALAAGNAVALTVGTAEARDASRNAANRAGDGRAVESGAVDADGHAVGIALHPIVASGLKAGLPPGLLALAESDPLPGADLTVPAEGWDPVRPAALILQDADLHAAAESIAAGLDVALDRLAPGADVWVHEGVAVEFLRELAHRLGQPVDEVEGVSVTVLPSGGPLLGPLVDRVWVGLGIWTQDVPRALDLSRSLTAESVWINGGVVDLVAGPTAEFLADPTPLLFAYSRLRDVPLERCHVGATAGTRLYDPYGPSIRTGRAEAPDWRELAIELHTMVGGSTRARGGGPTGDDLGMSEPETPEEIRRLMRAASRWAAHRSYQAVEGEAGLLLTRRRPVGRIQVEFAAAPRDRRISESGRRGYDHETHGGFGATPWLAASWLAPLLAAGNRVALVHTAAQIPEPEGRTDEPHSLDAPQDSSDRTSRSNWEDVAGFSEVGAFESADILLRAPDDSALTSMATARQLFERTSWLQTVWIPSSGLAAK